MRHDIERHPIGCGILLILVVGVLFFITWGVFIVG